MHTQARRTNNRMEVVMTLPSFKYHPDPIATGGLVASDTVCCCCGEARGYIYTGPAYAVEDYDQCICPWCIADGSAHEKLGVSFTDENGIGGYGQWEAVPASVIEEVAYRTPGFSSWQQEQWWTHCGDAAEFLGTRRSKRAGGVWPTGHRLNSSVSRSGFWTRLGAVFRCA